jgi:hypothetical protein
MLQKCQVINAKKVSFRGVVSIKACDHPEIVMYRLKGIMYYLVTL